MRCYYGLDEKGQVKQSETRPSTGAFWPARRPVTRPPWLALTAIPRRTIFTTCVRSAFTTSNRKPIWFPMARLKAMNRILAAGGKVPVIGLLKRQGKVCTKIIPYASLATLYPAMERKLVPDSIVYSDCWQGYNVLDVSEFKHCRINHSKLFADEQDHINGIENFWNQARGHLQKFNGVPREHFGLFLKECAWRFNNPNPQNQLRPIKQWVKGCLS